MTGPYSWPFVVAFAYVGLTVGALGWILLKHLSADWRVRRRHEAISEHNIEFDLGAAACTSGPVINIVLVHGVWALRGDWHQRDSDFLQRLERELTKGCGGFRVRIRRFLWTGGNTLTDRNRAARRYQHEIASFNAQPSVVATFVVAHSHGGNVALQAIASEPALREQVTGLVAVATPFLASHQREWVMAIPMSLVNGSVFAGLAVVLSQGFFEWPHWGTPASYALLAVTTVLSMVASCWQSRRILRAIPPSDVVSQLSKSLLVIRTSGDEAGASLGASYILGYAARIVSRFITACVEVPTRWIVAAWCSRVATETVRVVVHGVVETAISGALLPFGPETYIAAPYVIVSAEAIPPTGESPHDAVPVLQLPLKESPLQHSFDRHREELARIISLFVESKLQHASKQIRAA
jgi:pimeloyl-ACP methyl ester carboxylesterase